MKIHTTLGITTMLSLSLLTSFPAISRADAIYNAIALVDLSITGFSSNSGSLGSKPRDLVISAHTNLINEGAINEGTAFADQFTDAMVIGVMSNNLGFNDGLSQQAIATGESTLGMAVSVASTQGFLAIHNRSLTKSYSVDFEVDYSYLVDANITKPNLEFSAAQSVITLESNLIGSLLDLTVSSDSDVGDGLLTESAILPFSIFVEPDDSDLLALTVHATGAATSVAPVPEPATLSLLGIGLLGTAIVQWRKKQSRSGSVRQLIS